MPHYYPVIAPAGRSVAGDSLGFHAYSLRIDNCTNQWYLEESSLAYIPPYSLGLCLRLYGTGVAILLAQAPIGQPQLAPISGEQVVAVYSDQLRTEVAASPIRNFALVQTVSDLTEGPQPGRPPAGTDRLYADPQGNIHHLHSDGTDLTLVDPSNAGTLLFPTFDPHYQAMMGATALGGDLYGTVSNGHISVQSGSQIGMNINSPIVWGASVLVIGPWNPNQIGLRATAGVSMNGPLNIEGSSGLVVGGTASIGGNLTAANVNTPTGYVAAGPAISGSGGDLNANRNNGTGYVFLANASHYVGFDGSLYTMPTSGLQVGGAITSTGDIYAGSGGSLHARSGTVYMGASDQSYIQMWNPGEVRLSSSPGNFYTVGLVGAGTEVQVGTTLRINGSGTITWDGSYFRPNGSIAFPATGSQIAWPNGSYISGNAGYVQGSSAALKHNYIDADDDTLLAIVADPRPRVTTYLWEGETRRNTGFLADELAAVVPDVIQLDDRGAPAGYYANELTAILWGAVRALNAKVEALSP